VALTALRNILTWDEFEQLEVKRSTAELNARPKAYAAMPARAIQNNLRMLRQVGQVELYGKAQGA